MKYGCERLCQNEWHALLNALRRDTNVQREKAERYPLLADYFQYNVRMNTRIIEAFERLDPM